MDLAGVICDYEKIFCNNRKEKLCENDIPKEVYNRIIVVHSSAHGFGA